MYWTRIDSIVDFLCTPGNTISTMKHLYLSHVRTIRLILRDFLFLNELKPFWFKNQAQLRIYGERVCKDVIRSFLHVYGITCNRNCMTPLIEARGRVLCRPEHLCRVAI